MPIVLNIFESKQWLMYYLNLDPQFTPFGVGINFEAFTFSGGELHIKIKDELTTGNNVTITTRPRSFNDMGMILLAADALKRAGIKSLNLFIPYFPAARQDRLMVIGEPLSVKVYAEIINSVGFEKVTIYDAHSEVTPALIENVNAVSNHQFVENLVKNHNNFHLVSPDAGALKKVHKLAQVIKANSVIECSKMRDVKTGRLSGFKVYCDDLQGKDCIIVDDICDGGGTFLGLADELRACNAGKLILVVSHGIFSKGTDALLEKYDTIYTTDSFRTVEGENINCVSLNETLLK